MIHEYGRACEMIHLAALVWLYVFFRFSVNSAGREMEDIVELYQFGFNLFQKTSQYTRANIRRQSHPAAYPTMWIKQRGQLPS